MGYLQIHPAHKMVEKFGKSWILLIVKSAWSFDGIVAGSFTRERLTGNTLIICLIASKYH